jgi:anti-sigma regulatory factor (Ser/Thr protein kinase)
MLEALETSQRAQRRLVADASHELRTPLTSLRTNLEVLGRDGLGAKDQQRLRADVLAQLEELTLLVSDLVELAREEDQEGEREPVRLDELVAAAVARAARNAPGVRFASALEPTLVEGIRGKLDRAVANLLDNAAKYGGGEVEVSLVDGELMVRDHGPGIADEDMPYVFDRFYRSPSARGRPGSGLGLGHRPPGGGVARRQRAGRKRARRRRRPAPEALSKLLTSPKRAFKAVRPNGPRPFRKEPDDPSTPDRGTARGRRPRLCRLRRPGDATADASRPDPAGTSTDLGDAKTRAAELAFARCMRGQGIDFRTPARSPAAWLSGGGRRHPGGLRRGRAGLRRVPRGHQAA